MKRPNLASEVVWTKWSTKWQSHRSRKFEQQSLNHYLFINTNPCFTFYGNGRVDANIGSFISHILIVFVYFIKKLNGNYVYSSQLILKLWEFDDLTLKWLSPSTLFINLILCLLSYSKTYLLKILHRWTVKSTLKSS